MRFATVSRFGSVLAGYLFTAFVRLLLTAGGQRADGPSHPRVHVLIAMRSEFLGRASVYRGLPEAIDQGQYLIPRLSREQLHRAIECPARAGLHVEAKGRYPHHVAEAAFKAVGRALRTAVRAEGAGVPSTKGLL